MRTIAAAILALAVLAPPVQAASSACGGEPVPEEQALADAELANLDAQEVAASCTMPAARRFWSG